MRTSCFLCQASPLGRGELIRLARFARLASVGKSARHQRASSADLPTRVSLLANGTYRLGICREILPAHRSRSQCVSKTHPLPNKKSSPDQHFYFYCLVS